MTEHQRQSALRAVALPALALAVGMGVGRFGYTPILPLMIEDAGLTNSGAATLATANYIGYLVGAIVGIVVPATVRSLRVYQASMAAIVISLAVMPLTGSVVAWSGLRGVAGVGSALLFMYAVASAFAALGPRRSHLSGWAFSGVGIGVALSGLLVFIVSGIGDWAMAWYASALLGLVLAVVSWRLVPAPLPATDAVSQPRTTHGRSFYLLLGSYTLEGVGYIIAGTFLVAAVGENAGATAGSLSWILVGLAAAPSAVMWSWFAARGSRPSVLTFALGIQAIGIALPAVVPGAAAALVAAVLFGGTFLGVANMSLGLGQILDFPRAVAILTTGYSVGQIAGPLIVAPLLHAGYQQALLVGGAVVLLAALVAAALRVGYPPAQKSQLLA